MLLGDAVIVLAKAWCLLNDPRAILVGDVRISDDDECSVLVLRTNGRVRFSTFPVNTFPSPAQ